MAKVKMTVGQARQMYNYGIQPDYFHIEFEKQISNHSKDTDLFLLSINDAERILSAGFIFPDELSEHSFESLIDKAKKLNDDDFFNKELRVKLSVRELVTLLAGMNMPTSDIKGAEQVLLSTNPEMQFVDDQKMYDDLKFIYEEAKGGNISWV